MFRATALFGALFCSGNNLLQARDLLLVRLACYRPGINNASVSRSTI